MKDMEHMDEPVYGEEEESLHNYLSYKQSFFWYNDTIIFPNNINESLCLQL